MEKNNIKMRMGFTEESDKKAEDMADHGIPPLRNMKNPPNKGIHG